MDIGLATLLVGLGAPIITIGGKLVVDTRAIRKQVTPSNGVPSAEILEQVQREVRSLRDDMQYHVTVQHGRGPTEDQP